MGRDVQSSILIPLEVVGKGQNRFAKLISPSGEYFWVYIEDIGDLVSVYGGALRGTKRGKTLTRAQVKKDKQLYTMRELGVLMGFESRHASSKAYRIYKDTGLLTRIGKKWYMSRETIRRELWERLDEMNIL